MEKRYYKKYKEYEVNYDSERIWNIKVFSIILILICLLLLVLDIYIARQTLPRQLDDVHPNIYCEYELMDKSEILMIIPIFENVSIAENKTWCLWILSLNKTLGMHGVYHSYNEFNNLIEEDYVERGIREFKKCFGYSPKVFEAPQLELSKENRDLLVNMGFIIRGEFYSAFHKVYHCSDTGKFSNKIIDWV